jgi:hypothetical protein
MTRNNTECDQITNESKDRGLLDEAFLREGLAEAGMRLAGEICQDTVKTYVTLNRSESIMALRHQIRLT